MFGPNSKPSAGTCTNSSTRSLVYNDGGRVLHKTGRFVTDRYAIPEPVGAGDAGDPGPMRLIDGPVDPNSGAHMARRYQQ